MIRWAWARIGEAKGASNVPAIFGQFGGLVAPRAGFMKGAYFPREHRFVDRDDDVLDHAVAHDRPRQDFLSQKSIL